mmetsp:Transcript_19242/g.62840  ORF Transcript_19242/g.62840 Transcript_19242/m.62840 type:complete len:181 (-) Transcript_19242:3027-3569(-)
MPPASSTTLQPRASPDNGLAARTVAPRCTRPCRSRRAPSPACRWSLSLRHAAAAGATLTGTTASSTSATLGGRGCCLLSSNEDRKTASSAVMWVVEARVPCTIHLNYRSARHVAEGRQEAWLRAKGFAPNGALRSAVSSGVPNGPYSGPVYSKVLSEPGSVELMGSATWEGTYFVFIDCS